MLPNKTENPYQLIKPNQNRTIHLINFGAEPKKTKGTAEPLILPRIRYQATKSDNPVNLPDVPYNYAKTIINNANSSRMTVGDYLAQYIPLNPFGPIPEPSVTDNVGNTEVTTLIDAKQIFNKKIEYIKSAKKNIQIEMFEFQNMDVDGNIWPSGGAEGIEGWHQQQRLLNLIKHKQKKGVNVQVILDTHKWYIDGNGEKKRHFGNMNMIRHLRENGIDVVPYPRPRQGGALLQHVKFLAVDGKKAVIGGMNWGNHSSANHDACIAIETQKGKRKSEVDNMIMEIFNTDWTFAWERLGKTKLTDGPLTPEEQKFHGGIRRAILQENIDYMNIVGELYNNDEDRNRYKFDANNANIMPNGVKISPDLNLPEVSPVEKPAIKVLTNLPREYSLIGSSGSESIGDYIKNRIDTAKSLRAELFALTHFEIALKLIDRVEEDRKYKKTKGEKGRPFDVQILVDPGILDQFPYCRKVYDALRTEGVPIKKYKVNSKINQRMHAKWAVFDNEELLIGSVNWSAVGLENNLEEGFRKDYPRYNQLIHDEIEENQKEKVIKREKGFGFPSIFDENGKIHYHRMLSRKESIRRTIAKHSNDADNNNPPTVIISSKDDPENNDVDEVEVKLTINNLHNLERLMARYKTVKYLLDKEKDYRRGNHEAAVALTNKKISETYLRQFDKDWKHSQYAYETETKPGNGKKLLLTLREKREPSMV